jgi:uncharacterized protein (DUF1499 family)
MACSGQPPATRGIVEGRLRPCPDSPNCVSSDDSTRHAVPPFRFTNSPSIVWPRVVAAIERMPRTTIVTQDSTYLIAEVRSRVFRFVDDMEFHLRSEERLIATRSAARLGRWDLGVNRRRVERLRRTLQAEGIIQ